MFEEGRLFLKLRESDNGAFYPDIILEGVENIYGYKDPTDYSWDEWLYQRNIICHVFRWDENSKKYILVEENRELLQQVEGVYPIWN